MQWEGREESENVEDRRSLGGTSIALGGGGLILVLVALVLGVNPQRLIDIFQGGGGARPAQTEGPPAPKDPKEERLAHFAKVIFHDTEVVWDDLFKRAGRKYVKPTLVLFTGRVDSACGGASAAVGPFYCPGDDRVYIDLSFYRDLEVKLGGPGEFARAYVIAHEVGHHVQNQLGYNARIKEMERRGGESKNSLSVRMELQADFLAGVWAHHADQRFHFLEKGDIESALNAAKQIGDDRLLRRAGRDEVRDSFTHGSSEERVRWFRYGFETGDVSKADLLMTLPAGGKFLPP